MHGGEREGVFSCFAFMADVKEDNTVYKAPPSIICLHKIDSKKQVETRSCITKADIYRQFR